MDMKKIFENVHAEKPVTALELKQDLRIKVLARYAVQTHFCYEKMIAELAEIETGKADRSKIIKLGHPNAN